MSNQFDTARQNSLVQNAYHLRPAEVGPPPARRHGRGSQRRIRLLRSDRRRRSGRAHVAPRRHADDGSPAFPPSCFDARIGKCRTSSIRRTSPARSIRPAATPRRSPRAWRDASTGSIIECMFADALTGKAGATTVQFPSGNQIAVDYVETGSTTNSSLTPAKVRKARELLLDAEAGEEDDLFIACSQRELTQMMKSVEVGSRTTTRSSRSSKARSIAGVGSTSSACLRPASTSTAARTGASLPGRGRACSTSGRAVSRRTAPRIRPRASTGGSTRRARSVRCAWKRRASSRSSAIRRRSSKPRGRDAGGIAAAGDRAYRRLNGSTQRSKTEKKG